MGLIEKDILYVKSRQLADYTVESNSTFCAFQTVDDAVYLALEIGESHKSLK